MAPLPIRMRLLGRAGRHYAADTTSIPIKPKTKVGFSPGDLEPSLAALIPKLPFNASRPVSEQPWVKHSEKFFQTWKLVAPCMPKYDEFLQAHKEIGPIGNGFQFDQAQARKSLNARVMSDTAQVALAEFYLSLALRFRPGEVDDAGSDSAALLKIARQCAEEDFEPFIEEAQKAVANYDRELHMALEETTPFYEVDDGLFWHANFDVVAAASFQHFITALGHGSGFRGVKDQAYNSKEGIAKTVDATWEALIGADGSMEPARRAAMIVWDQWSEASSMPVKGHIRKTLMEHGLLVSTDPAESKIQKLLPELRTSWEVPIPGLQPVPGSN